MLLKKSTEIWSDSFFIAGAPYPQVLLDAFGVSQGQSTTSVTYSFFAKGYPAPVLEIEGGQFSMLAEFGVEVSATQEIGEHTIPMNYPAASRRGIKKALVVILCATWHNPFLPLPDFEHTMP